MTDLRIAVIGLGVRSSLAQHAHRPGQGSRVVIGIDPRPNAATGARERFGTDIAVLPDHRALSTADVDAAFVFAPDHLHEEITVDLLRAGITTFVDKPLAITTAGCDRVLTSARETGTRLYVGHNLRHAPFVRAMRDVIESGAIGEVRSVWCRHFVGYGGDFYFKDWHADRRYTTSLLLQKGAHDLDVIHWLAGGRTAWASAFGDLVLYGRIDDRRDRNGELMTDWFDPDGGWPPASLRGLHPVTDVEDLSVVNLRLDNGVIATYQQCHFTPDYWRNYTVIGTAGRLENFGDLDGAEIRVWNRRRSGYRADADTVIAVPAEDGSHGGADRGVVAEFLAFTRDGGATLTSPAAARDAVAAGHAATESLRTGGAAVEVPALDAELSAYFDVTAQAR